MNASDAVIDRLAADIHSTAMKKDFWDPPHQEIMQLSLKLGLVVSEVMEALDVLRTPHEGKKTVGAIMTAEQAEHFFEELADVIIRALDITAHYHWRIDDVIRNKMAKNDDRPRRHGKNF